MNKEEKLAFVRGYKMALAEGVVRNVLPECSSDIHSKEHDMADLGDPCFCGSDNCEICVKCGAQNHD